MNERRYSVLDHIIIELNSGLGTLFSKQYGQRPNPAAEIAESELTPEQQRNVSGLMRVNHTGEVCAQALYRGQMCVSKTQQTKAMLQQAAIEETDHLAWTHERLQELNAHRSYLNVFWYSASFLIGLITARFGDQWSLGFVEETEHQVCQHLQKHLVQLPAEDQKSKRIVEQMQQDEAHHGDAAVAAGATELPFIVKKIMHLQSKVMTTLAYWV